MSFADISSRTVLLTLVGPDSGNVLKEIGGDVLAPIVDGAYSSHTMLQFAGAAAPVIVAVGCGLAVPGYNLIVDESIAGDVFAVLAAKGCVPAGQQEWERMRTLQVRGVGQGRETVARITRPGPGSVASANALFSYP